MNLSIVTSFVISGLLLVSVLALNNQVSQSSTETTLDIISKSKIDNVKDLISQDFSRIGFGDSSKINNFFPNKINFKADVFDQGPQQVQWHLPPGKPATGTSNPNDRILQRTGSAGPGTGNQHKIDIPVVNFELTGYSDATCETPYTTVGTIRCIEVEIIFESPEPIAKNSDGEAIYQRTSWHKKFVPSNLQF